MKTLQKKLLIFDLDGTLIDSVPDLTMALNQTLKEFDGQVYTQEDVKPWIGNGVEQLVKRALSGSKEIDQNLNEDDVDKATEIYLDKYEYLNSKYTKLYPFVKESLDKLRTAGFTLALLTNKPHRFVKKLLEKMELDSYFVQAIGANFLEKKKPDPMALNWIMEQTGFTREESVMIGDSKNDILAAQNAHIDSIGVTYGYNYNEPIREVGPTLIIDNFNDLINILEFDKEL